MNENLRYGSALHTKIRDALRARVKLADDGIGKKEAKYDEDEEIYQGYVTETEADAVRDARRDEGKPQYTTLTIPYSYAILLTAHTYWVSVFLSRSPVMQFMARHGKTKRNVQAVEALVDYQINVGNNLAPLYIWLLDPGQYGMGVLGCYWDTEYQVVSSIKEEQQTYLGIPLLGKTKKVKRSEKVKTYEGNRLYNIRVYDFLYDPRVSLLNFQLGEFAGRRTSLGWNHVVKRKISGQYQNIEILEKYLKSGRKRGEFAQKQGSGLIDLPQDVNEESSWAGSSDLLAPENVALVELCIELIPKNWGLGTGEEPEKWVFTLAEDEVIIEAQPYEYWHAKFPYQILPYEIEGYGINKRSMLEIVKPLSDTLDWLVNTHFYNIRSILNGRAIYDPSRLTGADLKTDQPGQLVRMKPNAYGQDVRTMFYQIPMADVTQGHMRDTQIVEQMIQRVTGVTDNLMGLVNPGGRKTATEVRTSSSTAANRLKTQAEYFSAVGFGPLGQMMLQNTQQYYDMEEEFRIAGDLLTSKDQAMMVTPEDIAGFYDFVAVDGTMPIDRFAQVNMWTQLMGQMRNFPEIMQEYDMGGVFSWIAKLGGLKDIDRFKIDVVPDEAIANGVQAGNLVPIGGMPGGRAPGGQAARPRPAPGTQGPVQGPGQIPSMGPSG